MVSRQKTGFFVFCIFGFSHYFIIDPPFFSRRSLIRDGKLVKVLLYDAFISDNR